MLLTTNWSTDAIGLVEKVIAVAERLLCVLVDRNGDRLDVLIAVALSRGPLPKFGKRVDPRRTVRLVIVPFQLVAHHQLRPPRTRPLMGPPCSFLSRSRSSADVSSGVSRGAQSFRAAL